MTAIECTAERPYSRDVFRDKRPKKAQNVQQNVPIVGTSFGTNELQEQFKIPNESTDHLPYG